MTRSLPADVDDLTPEWLSRALAVRHPGVRVGGVEVLDRTERTNLHAWLRLDYDVAAGAPETLFCKLPPTNPEHRARIGATGMGTREAWFYRDLAPRLSMRMPEVHYAEAESGGDFVLLLEDLSARGCAVSDGTWAISGDLAAGAIEDLAELHVRFEDAEKLAAIAPWASETRPRSTEFTVRTLRHVIEHHADKVSAAYLEVARRYADDPEGVEALWARGPRTLIHADAHIGNLFVDAGRVGFLDWGMLCVYPAMRDVSFFLTMGMDALERKRCERDLVRHYVDTRRALGGSPLSFDDAWTAHRLHAAYTVIASFLTMVPPYDAESRRVFTEAFRARSIASLDDLDSVGLLASLS
ncbi:MAG: phosphotransferase [Myxococcales bacterium]|nr:phosphotransferase [Myxococcales bacterium]